MRQERRVWYPDAKDLAIVTIVTGHPVIRRAELATRAGLAPPDLKARLLSLKRFGYLSTHRVGRYGARFTVVRMPSPGDEHEVPS